MGGKQKIKLSLISEKFGSIGALVAAMGCASCFPVLGSLGATLGLGFLTQFEGVFINKLLPIFTVVALISVIASWFSHKQHLRGMLGVAGPIMVLATLYLFWADSWSKYMFYIALALMLAVALWDLVSPAHKTCSQTKNEVSQ